MSVVTQTQAEVVRDRIREMFRPYLDENGTGPKIYDGSHEGLSESAKVIWWEEGPYEWAILAASGGVDEEMAELLADVAPEQTPGSYEPIKVEGLFLEPVSGSCLGVYPA